MTHLRRSCREGARRVPRRRAPQPRAPERGLEGQVERYGAAIFVGGISFLPVHTGIGHRLSRGRSVGDDDTDNDDTDNDDTDNDDTDNDGLLWYTAVQSSAIHLRAGTLVAGGCRKDHVESASRVEARDGARL